MKILRDRTYKELVGKINDLEEQLTQKTIKINKKSIIVSPGASSSRDNENPHFLNLLRDGLKIVKPEYDFEVVPIIRKLAKINPDMNQALNDFVKLANTGHKITFDPTVGANQIDEMRLFLQESSKNWHMGAAGMHGITNKMFRQAMIGGAVSNEWVPNMSLDNFESIRFINPERIRFVINKNERGYQPYQKIKNKKVGLLNDLRKLNPDQFKYYALNGDTDLPYGIPPYIAALDPIVDQKDFRNNIRTVSKIMGIMGYLDARMDKPDREADESEQAYESRMHGLLIKLKQRVLQGLADGVNVGFKDDHEFEFKATTRTAQGVKDIFEQNEFLIASALGYDAAFMGRPGATETMITILFTKMLASLTNIQEIIKENLLFGYRFALTLGGFNFRWLSVDFKPSTITDTLKYQQAQEILLRNLVVQYQYGLIGQDKFADMLGLEKPDQPGPRIDINNDNVIGDQRAKEDREKDKDASDRRSRDRSKPQGTRRTKPSNNNLNSELTELDENGIIITG
jgi:hypothetical protein